MILVDEGQSPIILCLPHSGAAVPNAIEKRLNATGRLQADLAWRLERVFDVRDELDVTILQSSISRYVIDLDKDPDTPVSAAADPARALCPTTTLDGKRIYQEGEEPGPTETEQRMLLFHAPFHKALNAQIDRLLHSHGKVIVLDCQSMRSHIKGVTDKALPLVSLGTGGGVSCDPGLRDLLADSFNGEEGFSVSVDEQTRGGFINRSFGRPDCGLHVVTLLFAQRSYLRHESPPFEPDKARTSRLRSIVMDALSRLVDWTETGAAPQDAGPADGPKAPAGQEPGAAAEIIPVDPMSLPRIARDTDGKGTVAKVEDGPVEPLLVAE